MKILLIGTPFHNYTDVLKEALLENDLDVSKLKFLKSLPVFDKTRVSRSFKNLITRWYNRWLICKVKREAKIYSGNLILILFGINYFSKDQIKELKSRGIKIVSWLIDSVYTHPQFLPAIEQSDVIFTYNQEEAHTLINNQLEAFFMPLMYDAKVYKEIPDTPKTIDLYFIGSIKERLAELEYILSELSENKFRIIIDGTYSKKKIDSNKYPHLYKHYRGYKLTANQINSLYNKTKVCLNLQPIQATSALNIRTFEILGAGAAQITNGHKELIDDLFPNSSSIIYRENIEDFPEAISYYIDNYSILNKERTSSKESTLLSKHSFKKRVSEALAIIENKTLWN